MNPLARMFDVLFASRVSLTRQLEIQGEIYSIVYEHLSSAARAAEHAEMVKTYSTVARQGRATVFWTAGEQAARAGAFEVADRIHRLARQRRLSGIRRMAALEALSAATAAEPLVVRLNGCAVQLTPALIAQTQYLHSVQLKAEIDGMFRARGGPRW